MTDLAAEERDRPELKAVPAADESTDSFAAAPSIPELREALDEIDARIVSLLASRFAKVAEIAATKSEHALEVRDLEREQEVLRRVEAAATRLQIPRELVQRVFCAILEYSVEYQRALRGPCE